MLISFTCCSDSSDYLEEGMTLADQYVSLDKSKLSVKYMSSTQKISVNATGSWEAHSDVNWITFDVSKGAGSSSINILIEENTNKTSRSGIVTIGSGSATQQIAVSQECSYYRDHQFVDLGLPSGTLWASCNIGASSPEQVGNYYAWGETKTKTSYTKSNYKYQGDGDYNVTKYCTLSSYGIVDSKRELEAADDAAVANWGGSWRMPTKNEFQELFTKCTIKREIINNIYVDIFTGPNGQSVIFPETGEKDGTTIKYPSLSMYWSSTLDNSSPMYSYGYWGSETVLDTSSRYCGHPIRPIYKN